ncbi:unnamed protein product [Effrenium voratum]|uniref:Uncharacterized protein n=1 Tax=Effrenium voratum TaxID=2562239 RepID=A0AA36IPM9_9DINO|nr:unnamed protein product [Effrenium voratum]
MGKKRQYEEAEQGGRRPGGPGEHKPRPGLLDEDDIPRPKKVKPQNLEKLSLEELHQRKHDLKQEENYQNMVMSKKKRGPYSASDIRATYTQVLRFQYLQKEVDLEIERRDARKEKQAEQKAMKRAQAEEAQRARRAALMAADDGFEGAPGVALPPEANYGYGGGSQFQDFHSMGTGSSARSVTGSRSPGRTAGRSVASTDSMGQSSFFGGASSSSMGMGQGSGFFGGAGASDSASSGGSAPMNPMMMMAQMMLETQKKLKEAQEKLQKVQDGK